MTRLSIDVLGPFRVLATDGREITIPSGKQTSLLQCLVYADQGLTRDRLRLILWPDSDQEAGRRSLRQALSAIRVKLGRDPFSGTTLIRLDKSVCNSDFWALRERYAASDYRGCLELIRGSVSATEPQKASQALYEIWESWTDTVKRMTHVSSTTVARAAYENHDEVEAEYAIMQGALAGLSGVGLRNDALADHFQRPGWSDRQIGAHALTSLVFRSRRGLRSALALVIEHEVGWTARSVRSDMSGLPPHTRPALIIVPKQRPLAHVAQALAQLPGGAGISPAADRVLRQLAGSEPYPFDDVTAQLEAINALADALDATTQEQAVLFIANVKELKQSTATIFAQAIKRYGGEGLTLFLCGEDQREMGCVEALTLQGALETRHHIVQFEPEPLGNAFGSAGFSGPKPARPTDWRKHAGWALITATAALLASFTTLRISAPTATISINEDVILCSDRGGAPQFYRWGHGWGLERISTDTASCIRASSLSTNADSIYLPALSGGEVEWRAYPNRRSRANLTGHPLPFEHATPWTIAGDSSTFIVLSEEKDLWTLYDTRRRDTLTVPLPKGGRLNDISGRSALIRTENASGLLNLYVVDLESGEITFETGGRLDETNGYWTASGQIVFARGRQGHEEDGSLDLVLADPANGSEMLLTQNDWNDYALSISPDGTQICWQSEELGHYEENVYMRDLRSGMNRPISQAPGRQEACNFSADGSLVVYTARDRGEIDLMIQPVEGGPPIRIIGEGQTNFVRTVPVR